MSYDVVLVTGREMPREDTESPLVVELLIRRGLEVGVVAWQDDLDWAAIPLVVVRTPWDYFAQLHVFLDWARRIDAVTTLVNPLSVIEWNSHKGYLLELRDAGVPILPTTLVLQAATADAQRQALDSYVGEVVIKPAVSVGAIGALRVDAGSPAAQEHLAGLIADGDVLVQPLELSVLTEGEISLMFFGDHFSHAVRKIPAAGDYRVQERLGGQVVAHQPTERQLEVAAAAIAVAPAKPTYARVDLVRPDDPAVMELEIIEPELFLGHSPFAADSFADELAGFVF
jgi:glutathione synthase/RimK-type ligase-like ATP-grasp enzyme